MKRNYIKLNETDNYLSLGNIFRIIKDESNCKNTFLQSELFCAIFGINAIADSTVNNYLTGFRAINTIYKENLIHKKNLYCKNHKIFYPTILKILSILENKIITNENTINSNKKFKNVCDKLYNIAKNDKDVSGTLVTELYTLLISEKYYEFFIECMLFAVLEKKQPISLNSILSEKIEKSIYSTNISCNDLIDFINTHLEESMWSSIRKLDALSKNNNALASIQMGFYEFHGLIAGTPRYIKSYNYYKIAADQNHPAGNWAIGFMYYNGYIGKQDNHDLEKAIKYFEKAANLGSISALNSLGIVYLEGKIKNTLNKEKAIKLFNKATEKGNIFALNNLGKICESEGNFSKAFTYFKKAADLGESWAANKVGEYYRTGTYVKKDIAKAFEYYWKSNETEIYSMSPWAKYNLAKYFYKSGNEEIKIEKNIPFAIELLKIASEKIPEACEELIYIYYSEYLKNGEKNKDILNTMKLYIQKLEVFPQYNEETKNRVEAIMQEIYTKKNHIKFKE